MQSPPRKGKLSTVLRSIHNEQLTKLHTKHQQECDLLEDIRNFSKQRAIIEKNYGEALLKLSTGLLQKKIPTITDAKTEDGKERKSVYSVWRTTLDENEKLAKARLAAAEVFHQQISESAKNVRASKMQIAKKCLDQLQKIHEEMQLEVRELDKNRKLYHDEEHVAHEARDRANDAEDKLKRKKGHFFQSLTSLQKNSSKFSTKRESCDIRATAARNEYLLTLASVNAQQTRFHDVDLPEIMKHMDTDVYEKTAEYFQLLSQTELFTCAATQSSYSKVKEMSDLITRQHNVHCYLQDWSALREKVIYQFEPCDDDKVDYVTSEHSASHALNKEARKWATKIAREAKAIRDCTRQIRILHNQLACNNLKDEPGSEQAGIDIEQKIDDMRLAVRKLETNRAKGEARLEFIRLAGVNVDEWIKGADVDSLGPADMSDGSLSRVGSIKSAITDVSGNHDDMTSELYDSDFAEDASDNASTFGHVAAACAGVFASTPRDNDKVRKDSTSVPGGTSDTPPVAESDTTSLSIAPMHCVALYNYTAQNNDELSIIEQEVLEVVGEGDAEGWVKARNSQGREGLVPQNYVEIDSGAEINPNDTMYPGGASFSSVDYTVDLPEWGDDEDGMPPSAGYGGGDDLDYEGAPVPPSSIPIIVHDHDGQLDVTEYEYCRAVYDYEATCPEEITFVEGQVIKILRRHVYDVDDGWWEGEVDGQTGLFPSLVIEELKSNGEPCSPCLEPFEPGELASPPGSAPPAFAPPPMPQFLSAAAHVIITLPTPEMENQDDDEDEEEIPGASYSYSAPEFELELSDAQQSQYHTQFSTTDSNANETDEFHSIEGTPSGSADKIDDITECEEEGVAPPGDALQSATEDVDEVVDALEEGVAESLLEIAKSVHQSSSYIEKTESEEEEEECARRSALESPGTPEQIEAEMRADPNPPPESTDDGEVMASEKVAHSSRAETTEELAADTVADSREDVASIYSSSVLSPPEVVQDTQLVADDPTG